MANGLDSDRRRKRRERLWKSQKGICHWCKGNMKKSGVEPTSATIDHLRPLSKGGANAMYNTVLACRKCNNARGNAWVEEIEDSADLKSAASNGVMVQVHPQAPTINQAENLKP